MQLAEALAYLMGEEFARATDATIEDIFAEYKVHFTEWMRLVKDLNVETVDDPVCKPTADALLQAQTFFGAQFRAAIGKNVQKASKALSPEEIALFQSDRASC